MEDPTTLAVDFANEEIYESRVYQVRPEALMLLAAEAISEHPDSDPVEVLVATEAPLREAAFRFMAKRDRQDGLLTYILVGVSAGRRDLLERQDKVGESLFRESVRAFEESIMQGGVVEAPAVVTLDEWRVYERRQRPGP